MKTSPLIGLLMVAIWYLYQDNKQLKLDNKELNEAVRQDAIKNVEVMSAINSTLERLKEFISIRLDNLK